VQRVALKGLGRAAAGYLELLDVRQAPSLVIGMRLLFAGLLDKALVLAAFFDAGAFQHLQLNG